jgi:hypothetical protein
MNSPEQTEPHRGLSREPGGSNGHKGHFRQIALAGFLLCSGLVWLIQQLHFEFALAHGLTVPDSVNMTRTIQKMWEQGEILTYDSGFQAVVALYGWTWLLHPSFCFAVNCVLMLTSAALAKKVVLERLRAPDWAVLGLLANPYLVLTMPGPNKEIPLVFLTLLFADAMLRSERRWWLACAIWVPMYLLRDGYGLFMIGFIGITWLFGRHERLLPVVVLALMLSAAALWSSLGSVIPAMERNLSIYNAEFDSPEAVASALSLAPFGPLGGVVLYAVRLAYNVVAQAFFPVFLTDRGDIYWIGVAYWVYGLMALMASIGCAWRWLTNEGDPNQRLAADLALSSWFMISLSLFIQPRYFMPMLPIALGVMAALPVRPRYGSVTSALALALAVMSFLAITDRSPPPATPDVAATPAYVW